MGSPAPSDETDPYELWEPDPFEFSSQQNIQNTQSDKLTLYRYTDWDRDRAYNEDPPIYIYYSIK